jgi:hypothetical protein
MTRSSRVALTRFLTFGMLFLAAALRAQTRPPIVDQIAKAYGLDSYGQIEAIRYTFNADFGGGTLSRTWTWEPKADRVSYDGKDKEGKPVKVTYVRSQLGSQAAVVKEVVDPGFANDNYWLLLPFHVDWDKAANVEDTGMHKLPVGQGSARRVVVKYPSDGGYTPGDTWELFVGTDNRIRAMIYHRGGSVKPQLVTSSWDGYKKAGPLVVSLNHPGTADGKPFRIWFTNVAVKLAGSDAWLNAQ